jgi:cellulose synthase/poly-beta-1,6-N-acetylglucosamine synthase-like glycosyltransferase
MKLLMTNISLTHVVSVLLLAIYLPALAILFVYSANLYYMTFIAWWHRRRRPAYTLSDDIDLPHVTVQLPLYNERYVSQRIIDAAARLDWPADKLDIQVLDDSTDETAQIVAEAVCRWKAEGVNITHLRRPDRQGYKAGALAFGLEAARGEYICIFDADFVPAPGFLRDLVPSIAADPAAAFVQSRWEHLNREESWLTAIQAIAIDGHFSIEQQARCFGGFPFNFNGTAGIWRREAIRDAGGWRDTTLTEDLDLSYRTWLKGWHGLYHGGVAAPAELPPTMPAFKRQQARWAQGSIESARLLLGKVWRSDHPPFVKLQATIHLLGYLINPIMAVFALTYPLVALAIRAAPDVNQTFTLFSSLGPLTFAPTVFFVASQLLLRRRWQAIPAVLLFQVISAGLAMNTMRAALKALLGQRGEFLRTPKWGSTPERRAATQRSAYRLRADIGALTDLIWGVLCALVALLAVGEGHLFIAMYCLISALGALWVGAWSVWPDVRAIFQRVPQPVLRREAGGVSAS